MADALAQNIDSIIAKVVWAVGGGTIVLLLFSHTEGATSTPPKQTGALDVGGEFEGATVTGTDNKEDPSPSAQKQKPAPVTNPITKEMLTKYLWWRPTQNRDEEKYTAPLPEKVVYYLSVNGYSYNFQNGGDVVESGHDGYGREITRAIKADGGFSGYFFTQANEQIENEANDLGGLAKVLRARSVAEGEENRSLVQDAVEVMNAWNNLHQFGFTASLSSYQKPGGQPSYTRDTQGAIMISISKLRALATKKNNGKKVDEFTFKVAVQPSGSPGFTSMFLKGGIYRIKRKTPPPLRPTEVEGVMDFPLLAGTPNIDFDLPDDRFGQSRWPMSGAPHDGKGQLFFTVKVNFKEYKIEITGKPIDDGGPR